MKCYGWEEIAGDNCIYPIAPDNPKDKYDNIKVYKKSLTFIEELNRMVGYIKYEIVEKEL